MDLLPQALLVAVVALGAGLTFANDRLRRRFRIKRRIGQIAEIADLEGFEEAEAVAGEVRTEATGAFAEAVERRFPLAGGRRAAFWTIAAGVAAAAVLVPSFLFVNMPWPLAAVLGPLLGAAFGWNVGSTLEGRGRQRYSERLLVAIDDFERMVRFGIGPNQALASIAHSAEEPVQSSLRKVSLEMDFGVPLAAALGREARRIRVGELAMLSAVLSAQSSTGGRVAESVANIADMLRERLDNLERTKASTSESKISLVIMSLVPFGAVGIQAMSQPRLVQTLFVDKPHLLGIGAGLIVTGLVVAWLIVRSAGR